MRASLPHDLRTAVGLLAALSVAACSPDVGAPNAGPQAPRATQSQILLLNPDGSVAYDATAGGINDSGVVVGTLEYYEPPRATVWAPPSYKPRYLPLPAGAVQSAGLRIANDGTVLGTTCDGDGHCTRVTWRGDAVAPVSPQGDVRDICPCDGRILVGGLDIGGAQHAVVWTYGKLLDIGVPPGFTSAEFVAVDEGYAAATAERSDHTVAPFRWSPARGWEQLGTADVGTVDVNALGTVLTADDVLHPVGAASYSVPPELLGVTALNDSGWVTGQRAGLYDALNTSGIWIPRGSPVPGDDVLPGPGDYQSVAADVNEAGVVVVNDDRREHLVWVWQPLGGSGP